MRGDEDERVPLRLAVALVVLTFGSGTADAVAYLGLGRVLTANMNGNLVLLALFSDPRWTRTLVGAGVALVAFGTGAAVGTWLGRPHAAERWVVTLTALLVAVLVLQTAFAAVWVAVGVTPTATERVVLIAVSSMAAGAQTAAARRSGGPLSTTFVTGSLASVAGAVTGGFSQRTAVQLAGVLALVASAVSRERRLRRR